MATICPKCWGNGSRVEMGRKPSVDLVRATPVDRLPDGTEIRHESRLEPSPYGTSVCPSCGHEEKDAIPEGVEIFPPESDKR